MIPRAHITAWRVSAPWPLDEQVEQDLVLSRALSDIFARPPLREGLAFRGGTALHKLFLHSPGRYSEDLDLVQVTAGPIRPLLREVQAALDPWLGQPATELRHDSVRLLYRYDTTGRPIHSMRAKIEINTREHFSVEGYRYSTHVVRNPWHESEVPVTTFALEELLATKLRALYQRRKGRDLYDLWLALTSLAPDDERVVACLKAYLGHTGLTVSRAEFEANMAGKVASPDFRGDVAPLLRDGAAYDIDEAYSVVHERLIARIHGEAWKGVRSGN